MNPAVRIIFVPLRNEHGTAIVRKGAPAPGERVIRLDPRSQSPHYYLLHEMIHLERPGWSEAAVRSETARRWRKMTWKDKAALLKLLGRAHIGEPEQPPTRTTTRRA